MFKYYLVAKEHNSNKKSKRKLRIVACDDHQTMVSYVEDINSYIELSELIGCYVNRPILGLIVNTK